jgi:glycosyltransferase involved in cell wall biosynthesis
MAKIVYLTDYPDGAVSGYSTIAKPLCNGLVDAGHTVMVLGLSNQGKEHWEKFGIVPLNTLDEAEAAIHNLSLTWQPDIVVLSLDIPVVERMYQKIVKPGIKYVLITPLENGPLCQSWALALSQFDKVFFISQLGEDAARKTGLKNVGHLTVGVDPTKWFPAREREKEVARKNLGFLPEEKIILTVADNQERKNLGAGLKIMQTMKDISQGEPFRYVMVTREQSPFGWRLQELAKTYGVHNNLVIFDRGMEQEQLRLLYICSDAFLLPSKGEGLGLPVLEAMACGVNVVATNTGAITELLQDGRGWLVEPEYTIEADVWGNSRRDFISTESAAHALVDATHSVPASVVAEYIASRTWENTVKQMTDCIKELTHA